MNRTFILIYQYEEKHHKKSSDQFIRGNQNSLLRCLLPILIYKCRSVHLKKAIPSNFKGVMISFIYNNGMIVRILINMIIVFYLDSEQNQTNSSR